MNRRAAIVEAARALNALPGDADPSALVTVRADALRWLCDQAEGTKPAPLDAAAFARVIGGFDQPSRHPEPATNR